MKLIISFIFAISLLSCQPKNLPTILNQSEGYALLKISHETTKDELASITEKLVSQSIQIDYSGSEFYSDGKLKKLSLAVIIPEGNRGVTAADIVALQYRYFGFLYQKEGSPVFKIGEI